MTTASMESLVAAANGPLRSPLRNGLVGGLASGRPRFELYHAAPSLCSHKVRALMAEKGVPYLSHDLNLIPLGKAVPENYRPGYVRLRLQGAPGAQLVTGYTGRSSVCTEGFDPCVVPTLVDHEKAQVVVDSANICKYLDQEAGAGAQLIPEELAEQVAVQVDQIDQAPHVAVLYGAHPDGDDRPPSLAKNIKDVHGRKIRTLKRMMTEAPDDAEVQAAYESKIAKESSAHHFVYDAASMRNAHAEMHSHVEVLERQLQTHDGPWVLGAAYTLADILWTCSLFRLKWLGLGRIWQAGNARPRVAEYAERAFQRPSFQAGVLKWPVAYPPSPHVPEFSSLAAAGRFVRSMVRRTSWPAVLFGR